MNKKRERNEGIKENFMNRERNKEITTSGTEIKSLRWKKEWMKDWQKKKHKIRKKANKERRNGK